MIPFKTLFKEPAIYVVLSLLTVFLYLTYNRSAAVVIGFLVLTAFIIENAYKGRLKINNISGNTQKAVVFAVLFVFIQMISSIILSQSFGYTATTFSAYIADANLAITGSTDEQVFAALGILKIITLVVIIPFIETVVALKVFDAMLTTFKSTYSLSDIKVWISALLIGISSVFYHAQAYFIPETGAHRITALIIVGTLFTLTCLLAIITKEMESAIYYHIFNNGIAVLGRNLAVGALTVAPFVVTPLIGWAILLVLGATLLFIKFTKKNSNTNYISQNIGEAYAV